MTYENITKKSIIYTNIHFTETWVCVDTKVQLGADSQSLAVAYSELFVAGIFN